MTRYILLSDTDCRVCGVGNAFAKAENYDVCPRCGWIDEPRDNAHLDRPSNMNAVSLDEAKRRWPIDLVDCLSRGALSTLRVVARGDRIGGFDFVVDGVSLRAMFGTAGENLKAVRWPGFSAREPSAGPATGSAETLSGRSRLYVCPQCGGDAHEPALTADVIFTEDRVIWSRIGLERYAYACEGWELDLRGGPAGFAFDRRDYHRAFENAASDDAAIAK
jgi:hypothetical protein